MNITELRAKALEEVRQENLRAAINTEKERIRAQSGRGLWQRLIDKLPFTITRKSK